ncbi:MAG TPA: helix-turn-helix domain-containing protein [Acidobacteriaceae bacterium]|nr:helix-turn-helix domain-containing protein [Acidobacteriaceae bacterium]
MATGMTSTHHFGDALRGERQRRSVSLEDIAQTTKVTVRSLQALEAEAFDQLPGGILGKGIVRSYVRFLGLDEKEWVARFLDASGQNAEAAGLSDRDWVNFALNVSTNRVREKNDLKLRWAGVVALLLLLVGLGWFVWGFVHERVAVLAHPAAGAHSACLRFSPVVHREAAIRRESPFTAAMRKS